MQYMSDGPPSRQRAGSTLDTIVSKKSLLFNWLFVYYKIVAHFAKMPSFRGGDESMCWKYS